MLELFKISAVAMVLLSSCPVYSDEGGGTGAGNGGGGDRNAAEHWITYNGKKFESSIREGSYDDKIRNLIEIFPQAKVEQCPSNSKLFYLVLPGTFEKDFQFQLRPYRWFGRTRNEKFDLKELCGNEDLLAAYSDFVQALYEIEQFDEVGLYLVKQVVAKTGPISIIFSDRKNEMDAVGGKIEEYTWFDPSSGAIFWAKRDDCKGLHCFLRRTFPKYLEHELTHLLMFRVMGDHYPKLTLWHDPTHGSADGWTSEWIKVKTSEQAAYIEGLANAMETSSLDHHPYMLSPGSFNSLLWQKEEKRLCYWEPAAMGERGGKFQPPFWNEVYVSSTIGALFYSQQVEMKQDHEPMFVVWHHVPRLKSYIDTLIRFAPKNLLELAVSFDRQTGSDLGYRWLREFYFLDYRTQKNTRDEFYSDEIWEKTKSFCISEDKKDLFLSPLLKTEKEKLENNAWAKLSRGMRPEQISEDLKEKIATGQRRLIDLQARWVSVDEVLPMRKMLGQRLNRCRDRSQVEGFGDDQFDQNFYFELHEKTHNDISMARIFDFITRNCNSTDLESLNRVQEVFQKWTDLLSQNSIIGSAEHTERVKAWVKMTKIAEEAFSGLEKDLMMTSVLKKGGEPLLKKLGQPR